MPLPLAPIAVLALRTGLVAAAAWAVRRAVTRGLRPGVTDQRAEDAMDEMPEGLAIHQPGDRTDGGLRQTNTAVRMIRTLRWGNTGVEIDAALLGRLRLRKL
ncbi:hypothetical protein RNZ50_22355 [Paracoccaceae bacterium Fryx2]|nr:hypothetical protein [Paracoccaceae bacterium Fryx2]